MEEKQKNITYDNDFFKKIKDSKLSYIKLLWIFILYNIVVIILISIGFSPFILYFFYGADIFNESVGGIILMVYTVFPYFISKTIEIYYCSNVIWALVFKNDNFLRYFEKKIIWVGISRFLSMGIFYREPELAIALIIWDLIWLVYIINSKKLQEYFESNNYFKESIFFKKYARN